MQEPKVSPVGRRSPLAGLLTFAISLAVLFAGWMIFNASMRSGVGAAPDSTGTPSEVGSSESTAEPDSTAMFAYPTETPIPTSTFIPLPTVDPLTITGGFVENAVDVSTLPEYEWTGEGGGGGGGGGGCPEIDPTQSVSLIGEVPVTKVVCIYDLPDASEGSQFTVRLTHASGKEYIKDFKLMPQPGAPGLMAVVKAESTIDFGTVGYIQEQAPRNAIDMMLYFQAAQEYGEWQIEASTEAGVFASGTINVVAHEAIYSVTPLDEELPDPLDPFDQIWTYIFFARDHVLFAGRGLEAGKETILALYSYDPERTTGSVTVMVPLYATRITISEDGTYRSEFVVGSESFGNKAPGAYYIAVFDPQPGEFKPEEFGFTVNP